MANKGPGYVYILTNPSFREDWVKIGKSKDFWFETQIILCKIVRCNGRFLVCIP